MSDKLEYKTVINNQRVIKIWKWINWLRQEILGSVLQIIKFYCVESVHYCQKMLVGINKINL